MFIPDKEKQVLEDKFSPMTCAKALQYASIAAFLRKPYEKIYILQNCFAPEKEIFL